jgi:hypothetical protein
VTVRTDASWKTVFGLLVILSVEEAAGPTRKKALDGSGPGRFHGLVKFFFVVFLLSQLSRAVAPCSASGQSPRIALFSTENNDCKIHFKEENPMQRMRRTDGARGNTPATAISHSAIRNIPRADDPPLSVARKRAGFLGWSKGLMSTPIQRAPGGSCASHRHGTALTKLS